MRQTVPVQSYQVSGKVSELLTLDELICPKSHLKALFSYLLNLFSILKTKRLNIVILNRIDSVLVLSAFAFGIYRGPALTGTIAAIGPCRKHSKEVTGCVISRTFQKSWLRNRSHGVLQDLRWRLEDAVMMTLEKGDFLREENNETTSEMGATTGAMHSSQTELVSESKTQVRSSKPRGPQYHHKRSAGY